jgi:hypothetical protein
MKIIAFGHRRRVGKDTACKNALSYFRCNTKIKVERMSFGDKVKSYCFSLYAWGGLREGIYYENHPDEKEKLIPSLGKSPRAIWIDFGHMISEINPKTLCELSLKDTNPESEILIVPDLRRQIEVDYVRMFDGYIIRIDRNVEQFNDPCDSALAEYQDWDKIVRNDGSFKDFNTRIKCLMDEITKGWGIL